MKGWLRCQLLGNRCESGLNEYWRAYLGLSNHAPRMESSAFTEWDEAEEQRKEREGLLPSEFFGITEQMYQVLELMADTLNTGRILRQYDAYKRLYPRLAPRRVVEELYRQGRWVMEHPDSWVQVQIKSGMKKLHMLSSFGMKWSPAKGLLRIHDTYDFPPYVRLLSDIPERPREMKIRGEVSFAPETAACGFDRTLHNLLQL